VKISIDAEACTGHGRCYSLAPALFAGDEDGAGEVIAAEGAAALGRSFAVGSCELSGARHPPRRMT
jgi:ferredoxin